MYGIFRGVAYTCTTKSNFQICQLSIVQSSSKFRTLQIRFYISLLKVQIEFSCLFDSGRPYGVFALDVLIVCLGIVGSGFTYSTCRLLLFQ